MAGSDPMDIAAGVSCVVSLLGDRCPQRVAVGDFARLPTVRSIGLPQDEEDIAFEAVLESAVADAPDLLVLPDLGAPPCAAAAAEQAGRRIVIAAVPAIDACAAVESMGRKGMVASLQPALAGVLGVRLMERLCDACRRPVDPFDVMSPGPRHRQPSPGSYFVAQGCPSCRGSGLLRLVPVLEFLGTGPENGIVPSPGGAAALRRGGALLGRRTLFSAGLGQASLGIVDIREPLRLLLHEC